MDSKESVLWNMIDDLTISHVNDCHRIARQLMSKGVNLIAPYVALCRFLC